MTPQEREPIITRYVPERAYHLPEAPTEDKIAEIYDSIAPAYSEHRHSGSTDFHLVLWPHLHLLLNGRVNGADILDVGTGTGLIPHKLTKEFNPRHVVGIDISEKMLNIAKKEERDKRLSFLHVSVEELTSNFSENSFDIVISNLVFGHVINTQEGLQQVRRVLKPGGLFYLIVAHPERNNLYWQHAGNTGAAPRVWMGETWPGADGRLIPTQYINLQSWTEETNVAGFYIQRILEPVPFGIQPELVPESHPGYPVYQRYKNGQKRTIIFELLKPEN